MLCKNCHKPLQGKKIFCSALCESMHNDDVAFLEEEIKKELSNLVSRLSLLNAKLEKFFLKIKK